MTEDQSDSRGGSGVPPAWAIVVVFLLSVAIATCGFWDHYHFGWKQNSQWHSPLKLQHKRVDFIHNHACKMVEYIFPRRDIDSDLNEYQKSGFKVYSCDGLDTTIYIHDYELQP